MLKKEITYFDFDNHEHTETFYFNLSKSEIVELEVSYKDGLEETMKRIIAADDNEALFAEFKRLVLASYGERSEDGKRFMKTQDVRQNFEYSAAFDALIMELATDENSAAEFITGIIPSDLQNLIEIQKEAEANQQMSMPPPPSPAV